MGLLCWCWVDVSIKLCTLPPRSLFWFVFYQDPICAYLNLGLFFAPRCINLQCLKLSHCPLDSLWKQLPILPLSSSLPIHISRPYLLLHTKLILSIYLKTFIPLVLNNVRHPKQWQQLNDILFQGHPWPEPPCAPLNMTVAALAIIFLAVIYPGTFLTYIHLASRVSCVLKIMPWYIDILPSYFKTCSQHKQHTKIYIGCTYPKRQKINEKQWDQQNWI